MTTVGKIIWQIIRGRKRHLRSFGARHFHFCKKYSRRRLRRAQYLTDQLIISILIQVIVHLGWVRRLDFEKPRVPHGIVIHLGWLIYQHFVDFDDFPIQWRQNIGCRFHAFNHNDFIIFGNGCTLFGQFDKYDISQLRAGMFGNSDHDDTILLTQPFMLFCKFHCWSLLAQRLKLDGVWGRALTAMGSRLPRTSPNNTVPVADISMSTYPIATGVPTVEPNPPDVTVPIWVLLSSLAYNITPSRMGARVCGVRPTRLRNTPWANWSRMMRSPGNPPAADPPARRDFWMAHVKAASTGVVPVSMSCPYRHNPASSRRLSRAPRPIHSTFA